MKSKQQKAAAQEDDETLSPELKCSLRRSIAETRNPVRYAVFSDICGNGRWRLWLDVSNGCYGMAIDQATLFKCEHAARAVAGVYSESRRTDLLIAKLTTKSGKRVVLRYGKHTRKERGKGLKRYRGRINLDVDLDAVRQR